MTWRKIVDVSRYQGRANMAVLRSAGVEGLIIRLTHGGTTDPMAETYTLEAIAAGYTEDDLAFYTFCNPKRGDAAVAARYFLAAVRTLKGDTATVLMLDIESYVKETPNPGQIVAPAEYAAWLRRFVDVLRAEAPDAYTIGYTNDAYWSGGVETPLSIDDDWLVDNLDWIVARYPVYSAAGYARFPLPGPDGWPAWAFARAPKGPVPPDGAEWCGWQFSAGYNGQGARYGFASGDLDLNIVDADAWARWHAAPSSPAPTPDPTPTPTPPASSPAARSVHVGDSMLQIVALENPTAPGTPDGPRRWSWTGQTMHLLTDETDYDRLVFLKMVNPATTLATPVIMSQAEFDRYAQV